MIGSLLFQVLTNFLGLLIVPLSLAYIDKEKYGIWINASIMVTWLQNMNFGMGYGMQNRVAEAMAKDDKIAAREFVSITYKYSLLITLFMLFAGLIAGNFINWNGLFNTSLHASELKAITFIAFICFLVYFLSANLIPLLNSFKKTSVPKFYGLLINIVTILLLLLISRFSNNNLVLAALVLAIPAPLIYLGGNLYYFYNSFSFLRPQWIMPDKKKVQQVFVLGVKFFAMQLTTLIIFQSGTFIVTQTLGPDEVTPFNLINRYFYFLYFIFNIALTPFWSAFTEAYVKKEFDWIRKSLKILFIGAGAAAFITLIMLWLSFYIIPVWSRYSFPIGNYRLLLYTTAIFTVLLFFSSIVSIFLNGISKLKIQLITQLFMAAIVVPLSLLFIKQMGMGAAGVNLAIIISQVIYIIVCGRYMYLLISREMTASVN